MAEQYVSVPLSDLLAVKQALAEALNLVSDALGRVPLAAEEVEEVEAVPLARPDRVEEFHSLLTTAASEDVPRAPLPTLPQSRKLLEYAPHATDLDDIVLVYIDFMRKVEARYGADWTGHLVVLSSALRKDGYEAVANEAAAFVRASSASPAGKAAELERETRKLEKEAPAPTSKPAASLEQMKAMQSKMKTRMQRLGVAE